MRVWIAIFALAMASLTSIAPAEEPSGEKYTLRYKFTPGEELRWLAVHQGAWTTKVKGYEQKSSSTSKSTKVWKVTEIDADGKISFVHFIDNVNMWRQVGDRAEERYDSQSDQKAPAGYEMVAATVGKPVTEAVIDDRGNVVQREDKFPKFNLSVGDLVTPLPDKPIAVGESWHASDELRLPVQGGAIKLVKIRKVFKLEKVATGVATISLSTQVLTPVNDPHAEAQLMQHVTKGVIKFDIDAGRLLSRQLDWNDTVLGFEGPESSMVYLARFTEELTTAPRTASKADKSGTK
jgi:hypothetical protein